MQRSINSNRSFLWTLVCVTVKFDEKCVETIRKEIRWYYECGGIDAEHVIVVEDTYPEMKTLESSFNALMKATEYLCVQNQLGTLNHLILEKSRILILHLEKNVENAWNGAFFLSVNGREKTLKDAQMPKNIFLSKVGQIGKLAKNFEYGTWFCGSEFLWRFRNDNCEKIFLDRSEANSFVVFKKTDNFDRISCRNNEDSQGAAYCSEIYEEENISSLLDILYLPFNISAEFLTSHSESYFQDDFESLSIFSELLLATTRNTNENDLSVCRKKMSKNVTGAKMCIMRNLSKYKNTIGYLKLNSCDEFSRNYPINELIIQQLLSTLNADKEFINAFSSQMKAKEGEMNEPKSTMNTDELLELNRSVLFKYWLKQVENSLLGNNGLNILSILRSIIASEDCKFTPYYLISFLHSLCQKDALFTRTDRILSLIGDLFVMLADKESQHTDLTVSYCNSSTSDILSNVKELQDCLNSLNAETSHWLSSPQKLLIRAQHYYAASQMFIRRKVSNFCLQHMPKSKIFDEQKNLYGVRIETSVRIDLAGGWTDTPPITMELDKTSVVNMAVMIDGKKPVACTILLLSNSSGIYIDEATQLHCIDDLRQRASEPTSDGSLVCATLIVSGLITDDSIELSECFKKFASWVHGIKISTSVDLPLGSGLGTSSILAAAVISGLWTLMRIEFNDQDLIYAVLLAEQHLTTGGGWQDQVGGIIPGIKFSTFNNELNTISIRSLKLEPAFERVFESNLILIYTGRTRLAKNLVQEVIREWFRCDIFFINIFVSLAKNAEQTADLLLKGILPLEQFEIYYEDKKKLAVGCEPNAIKNLIQDLKKRNFIRSAWLTGAGGGGFLCAITSDGITLKDIQAYFKGNELYEDHTVHSISLDYNPLQVTLLNNNSSV